MHNTALVSQCLAYVHHLTVSAFRSLMAEGIKVHKCMGFCDLAAELRPCENSEVVNYAILNMTVEGAGRFLPLIELKLLMLHHAIGTAPSVRSQHFFSIRHSAFSLKAN